MSEAAAPATAEQEVPSYPVGTIARILLLTERQVQSLVVKNVLPKTDRGRYQLVPVVQGYIRYLRDRGLGRGNDDAASPGHQLARERASLVQAQTESRRLANEKARGEVADMRDVNHAVLTLIEAQRTALGRVAARVARGDLVLARRITEAIDEAMTELSLTRVQEMMAAEPEPDGDAEPDDDEQEDA